MAPFTTRIKDVSVYGLSEHLGINADYDEATATIEFDLEPEYRGWGMKSIYCDIKSIGINIPYMDMADELEHLQELEIDGKEFAIVNEAKFRPDGQYSIDDCEIDLKARTITIS